MGRSAAATGLEKHRRISQLVIWWALTAGTMSLAIGSQAIYHINGLQVSVVVLDARNRFGSVDYLIQPVSGSGTVWVSGDKLR